MSDLYPEKTRCTDSQSPHRRHRELVDRIEGECRVAEWRSGDIDLWPLASQDLFADIFRQAGRETAQHAPSFAVRAAATLATPVLNAWKSRGDLAHWLPRLHHADALLLGDGVSLDRADGLWRDRFGEPVAAALERQGHRCLMMQAGNLARLPWARTTYAANLVAARAAVAAALMPERELDLPDYEAAIALIEKAGVKSASLSRDRLARRVRVVGAQAAAFDRILRPVQPRIAFVVAYYSGLGHAFALACRRRGILCVDLQHCPHDGVHRAYRWSAIPPRGFSTLPALFWTWSGADAADIARWSDGLWHRAIAGGHTQLCAMDDGEATRLWNQALQKSGNASSFEREILVALQPIGARKKAWHALAHQIQCAPKSWRWWIRRHPASSATQDHQYGELLSLAGANVITGDAAQIPLPALLGQMDALVSLASGAAAEAAMLGVPAYFLDREALDTFPRLIEHGLANLVAVGSLLSSLAPLPASRTQPAIDLPRLEDTLDEIIRKAEDYSRLCRKAPSEKVDCSVRILAQRQAPRAA